ncbi:MAG: quinol:cytochrome C oxidoreductase [Bacteroidota bacterium]
MEDRYTFSSRAKRLTYLLMGIGVIALIVGIVQIYLHPAEGMTHEQHHHVAVARLWSNILINGFFFFSIGLIGTFFLGVQYASDAGWSVVFHRVMEAVSQYMPIGAIVLVIVFLGGTFHWHHLYHWMAEGVMEEGHEHYDAIIAHKEPYLNQAFFWIRTIAYLGIWGYFTYYFRKRSLERDRIGDDGYHLRTKVISAVFLVIFGYTSTTSAWDWLMSIDTHWFSTLFGWYIFSGMWISGMVTILLITLYLKRLGHLKIINDSHIHDMGKWVFGISFLWSYMFFCQFMLIWYSNIPEEVMYYQARIDDYTVAFWGMFLINFIFPMLLLMSKDAKRAPAYLWVVGFIIIIGHWLDVFILITPATVTMTTAEGLVVRAGKLGLLEVGMALGFLGFFINVVLRALTKAPLVVENHPFMEESLHHEIN